MGVVDIQSTTAGTRLMDTLKIICFIKFLVKLKIFVKVTKFHRRQMVTGVHFASPWRVQPRH